jgi:hypothetical protein
MEGTVKTTTALGLILIWALLIFLFVGCGLAREEKDWRELDGIGCGNRNK